MSDYTAIRDMVSHRVTFEFDTGAKIVGTIAACAPTAGPVQYVVLSKAQVLDAKDQVIARFDELPIVPNSLVSFAVTEGPL
jgi:hypothetical protein